LACRPSSVRGRGGGKRAWLLKLVDHENLERKGGGGGVGSGGWS
jgi:hypothetical protein